MDFRKEKDVEIFLENIETRWKLSVNEKEFVEQCLFNILEGDNITKISAIIDAVSVADWREVLDLVPKDETELYAERNFGLIYEDDCDSCYEKDLGDFYDEEIKEEYFDRFGEGNYDIVTEQQLEELKANFFAADFKTREKIIEASRS